MTAGRNERREVVDMWSVPPTMPIAWDPSRVTRLDRLRERSAVDTHRMCTSHECGPCTTRIMTPAEYQTRYGVPMPSHLRSTG